MPGKPCITPEFVERLRAVHEKDGSVFHILLDDQNVGRDNAEWCLQAAIETCDIETMRVAYILARMSRTQHLKLSQMVHGLWRSPASRKA